mgnify:FL=1|tara:strand:+ start:1072 stop:1266 length:195 start_codon:yes stop_codon:yes gene_type:complete
MVDMWEQFLEYVQHKGVPMSDGEWCSEALAFSGGNTIVACALLDMVHKSKVIEQMVMTTKPAEA